MTGPTIRPDAEPEPSAILNDQVVSALRAFGREPGRLLAELTDVFLGEAPRLLAEIQGAVDASSAAAAARTAHKLRGAGGHVGATRLAAACQEIELCAQNRPPSGIDAAVAHTRVELELALDALRSIARAAHDHAHPDPILCLTWYP